MTNKELFYFTGRCLALDENPEFKKEIIYKCDNDLIEWQAFVHLCSNELVLPTIYIKFKNHNLIEHLPVELAEHLHEIYELNVRRNKNILYQVEEITKVLSTNNIYPVFLKGAANLLDKLYSDIGERILADIDLLVPEAEYLTAAKLLEQEGYSIALYATDYSDYIDIQDLKHYPRLVHPEFESVIEIHRIPVDKKHLKLFNSETIFNEQKTPDMNLGCYVPSDRHKILHNFIHSQLTDEGFLFGFIPLREIYDLLLLSKRSSLEGVFSEIKPKNKAIAYFTLSYSILGLNKQFYSKKNFAFWLLNSKHYLNRNSSVFYKIFRTIIFVSQRIFSGYIGRPLKAIFYRDERQALIRRLRSPIWIQNHIALYTNFFKIDNKKKKNRK